MRDPGTDTSRSGTAIGHVRGLGPARHGAHDWWIVRLNSVALLALYVWLLVSLLRLPDLGHEAMTAWLRNPINTIAMLLLVVTTFHHIRAGVREWIDDYVHEEGWKFASLALLNFLVIALGALAALSVLKIAFGGGTV